MLQPTLCWREDDCGLNRPCSSVGRTVNGASCPWFEVFDIDSIEWMEVAWLECEGSRMMNHFLCRKQVLNWEYLLSIPTLQPLFMRLRFVRLLFAVDCGVLPGIEPGSPSRIPLNQINRGEPLNYIHNRRCPNGRCERPHKADGENENRMA